MAGGGASTGNLGDSRTQNNGSTATPYSGDFQPKMPMYEAPQVGKPYMGAGIFGQPVSSVANPNYDFAPAEPQPINWQPRPDTGQMMGMLPPRNDGIGTGPILSQPIQPMQPPVEVAAPLVQPEPVFNIKKDYELDSNQLSGADELAQARAQADAQRMAKEQAMMQMRAHEDFMNAGPYGAVQQLPYGQIPRGLAAQQAVQQGNPYAATLMRSFEF